MAGFAGPAALWRFSAALGRLRQGSATRVRPIWRNAEMTPACDLAARRSAGAQPRQELATPSGAQAMASAARRSGPQVGFRGLWQVLHGWAAVLPRSSSARGKASPSRAQGPCRILWSSSALLLAAGALAVPADAAPAPEPVRLVLDRTVTTALEQRGHGFAALMGATDAARLDALIGRSPLYADLAAALAADVAELRARMAADKRPLFEVTDENAGRVLDLRWLSSPLAAFRLVGVANRADRRDFTALTDRPSCGEVRLVYRLAYRFDRGATLYASRLPVNVNAVFDIPRDGDGACPDLAARWTPPAAGLAAAESARWLATGPLANLVLRQIELNAQIVRLPSGMETELGGQAIYLMRVFTLDNGRLVPKPLENTPDVARLKADAALRARLVDYVRSHVRDIDQGVFQLPAELLADKALSFSTFGSARSANHPFSVLLSEADLGGLGYDGLKLVASPAGLIARLDDATCTGCHQGAATAGFHLIGHDEPGGSPFNVVKVAISPHLYAEDARRRAYLAALAEKRAPDTFRPLSYAPAAPWQGDAPHASPAAAPSMACILPGGVAPFRGIWGCGAGTTCQAVARNPRLTVATGQCLPTREADLVSGMPCLEGEIRPGRAPYLDGLGKVRQINSRAARASPTAYTCRPAKLGVPGGSAYRQCNPAERSFAGFGRGKAPAEVCAVVGGKAFDLCVATDNFARCMQASVARGLRPACGAGRFCREDFMCQELPPTLEGVGPAAAENGFCAPTYFLFQMRVDGHPDPVKGVP